MEVRVEHLQGPDAGIVLLGLDRPGAKNALGRRLLVELREAVRALSPARCRPVAAKARRVSTRLAVS